MRWSVERRLAFIEERLYWLGHVNRTDLVRRFGVSMSQASGDIARYLALAPQGVAYDKRAKRYAAAADFRPVLSKPDARRFLGELRLVDQGILAAEDTTLRGVPIAAGDSLLLSYVSGNRDEDVFDDPFRFDITRDPNNHVAFGFGVHFCLGAGLARLEIRKFFTELLPRLTAIELDGEPASTATTFVGGLKHLPIRYTLT